MFLNNFVVFMYIKLISGARAVDINKLPGNSIAISLLYIFLYIFFELEWNICFIR